MVNKSIQMTVLSLALGACSFLLPAKDLPEYRYERFESSLGPLLYRELGPIEQDSEQKYPLVIVLHGAGERGDDNVKQLRNGGELFLGQNRSAYPAFVVFPQAPKKESWIAVDADRSTRPFTLTFSEQRPITKSTRRLYELIESYKSRPDIDPERIYLVGISMGAMGVFEILAEGRISVAAAISICGAAPKSSAMKIGSSTPLWILHGEDDNIIDAQHSIDVVKWIEEAGGDANLTLYPGVKHNSWVPAFEEPDLLEWLFSHNR